MYVPPILAPLAAVLAVVSLLTATVSTAGAFAPVSAAPMVPTRRYRDDDVGRGTCPIHGGGAFPQQRIGGGATLAARGGAQQQLHALPAAAATAAAGATHAQLVRSHHLVRIVFLRSMAFVCLTAFTVALRQNRGLIGDRGITPARRYLDAAELRGRIKAERRRVWREEERPRYRNTRRGLKNTKLYKWAEEALINSTRIDRMREVFLDRADGVDRPLQPSLLWLAKDRSNLNGWLDSIALAGIALSSFVLVRGAANVPLMLGLWLCQRSLMVVGGPWYGYGWDPQLAELIFHGIFLVPLFSLNPVPTSTPVPLLAAWAMRWFLFRIMMGAGLIKIKSGDPKWTKDFSAMDYFYETQPNPNPFTRYFHFMPRGWHRFEVWTNHFVELVAPWLLLMPGTGVGRRLRIIGAITQLVFQSVLIASGNLSFLNWLTMIPAIFCFDDAFVSRLLALFRSSYPAASAAAFNADSTVVTTFLGGLGTGIASIIRQIITMLFFFLVARLSVPVVRNLLARRQLMNASFDRFRLINTYGAFGVVSDVRDELIVESADTADGPWKEYQFKVKPGDVLRRPRWISPYHYRLDWQMWIASQCGSIERSPWLYRFLLKLLRQERDVLDLLDVDPWDAGTTAEQGTRAGGPKYIRIEKYRYRFYRRSKDGEDSLPNGKRPYWVREHVGRFFPRQGVATEAMLEALVGEH